MRSFVTIILAVAGLVVLLPRELPAQNAFALPGDSSAAHHTQVTLLLSTETARPGDTVLAGVDMKMEAGWHTYWKNPGDAGSATKIEWTLPPGVSPGDTQWPLPEKLPPAEVTTYGYENEVVLLVPLTLGTNLTPGALNISVQVSWLECKDLCVPASQTVETKLNVGTETKPSADATFMESWRGRLPQAANTLPFRAVWEKPPAGDTRPLLISYAPQTDDQKNVSYESVDFFPAASDDYEIQPATEIISKMSSDLQLRKQVKKYSGDWPREISGTVVIESSKTRFGYDVQLPVTDKPALGKTVAASDAVAPELTLTLLGQMLLFAFIGGLILNIMPCVLPVIALKILGFVSEAGNAPRRIRALGFVYTLGVLASFLTLAGLVIGAKAAGLHPGWGMQFGSPIFVVCLTTLVLLVALNLFGVFEVTLGGRALDTASGLASRSGLTGAFFNGVLATTLATPCSAPFLAPAIGFAFAQKAPVIAAIFLAVGLGLASPYLILSWQPSWLKFLPKPGVWMEKFKHAMGFPMLATVVWLFSVASSSYGDNVVWLGVFLVLVAFAAWLFGEFVQRGRKHKMAAAIITLLVLAGGYVFVLEQQLDWRAPVSELNGAGEGTTSTNQIDWQPWSPEAVTAARAAGRPVLVDFTASWCLTCQLNKKTSLEIPSVRARLKALNAVALIGDYTHLPPAITAELNRFNRAAVPLVLVYPKTPDSQPVVLPPFLTPGIVLSALDGAR